MPFAGSGNCPLLRRSYSPDEEFIGRSKKKGFQTAACQGRIYRLFIHFHEDVNDLRNVSPGLKDLQDPTLLLTSFFSAGRKSSAAEFMQ